MANFLLPQLNAEGPDYAGSFMRGMQIPYAFQQMQGRSELMNTELEKRKAIKAYAETGDINALKRSPETYIHMRKLEKEEKTQDLGLQKLGLEIAKQSVPYLLANPTPENYQDLANTMTSKFKIPASYFPPLKTSEEISAHITKLQEMALKPSERQALLPKAPEIKEQFDPGTGLKQKMQFNRTTGQWEPFGGLAKDTEEGLTDRPKALWNLFTRLNPGKEPTQEDLKQLGQDLYQRGLPLDTQLDMKYLERATALVKDSPSYQIAEPDEKLRIVSDMAKKLKGKGAGKTFGKTPSPTSEGDNNPWWWK